MSRACYHFEWYWTNRRKDSNDSMATGVILQIGGSCHFFLCNLVYILSALSRFIQLGFPRPSFTWLYSFLDFSIFLYSFHLCDYFCFASDIWKRHWRFSKVLIAYCQLGLVATPKDAPSSALLSISFGYTQFK